MAELHSIMLKSSRVRIAVTATLTVAAAQYGPSALTLHQLLDAAPKARCTQSSALDRAMTGLALIFLPSPPHHCAFFQLEQVYAAHVEARQEEGMLSKSLDVALWSPEVDKHALIKSLVTRAVDMGILRHPDARLDAELLIIDEVLSRAVGTGCGHGRWSRAAL